MGVVRQESLFCLGSGVLLVSGLADWQGCAPFRKDRRRHGQGRETDDRQGPDDEAFTLALGKLPASVVASTRRLQRQEGGQAVPATRSSWCKTTRSRNTLARPVCVPPCAPAARKWTGDGCGARSEAGQLSDPPDDARHIGADSVSPAALRRAAPDEGSVG